MQRGVPDAPPGRPVASEPVGGPGIARAVFLDFLAAAAALVLGNLLIIAPVVGVGIALSGLDVATDGIDAVVQSLMPQIALASVFGTLLAAVLVWLARARRMPALPAMPAARAYPLAIAGGLLIQLACIAIGALAHLGGTTIAPSNVDPVQQMARHAPWLMWLVVVVVAPLAEELLFRHVLLRRFALAGRAALGVALTALVFAALHEPVPGEAGLVPWAAAVALYVTMGVGFSVVYLRTGRLGAAFAAHAACNLLALSLAAFSTL